METLLEKAGDVQILHLQGRLDVSATQPFEDLVLGLLLKGERRLLMECAGLQYVSSSGLGVFLTANKRLAGNGRIVFAALTTHVQHVFQLVGFYSTFQICGTAAEAVHLLSAIAGTASPSSAN